MQGAVRKTPTPHESCCLLRLGQPRSGGRRPESTTRAESRSQSASARKRQYALQHFGALSRSARMLKKLLPLLFVPLFVGCQATLTNLTPQTRARNPDNLYMVEVALASRQQTLRWDSIKPQVVVGSDFYPMRPTKLMTNRWEGLLPVPSTANIVHYRYKFDFNYNALGAPRSDSVLSKEYTLRIMDNK